MIMGKPFESPKIAMDTKKLVIYPLSVEWVKYKIIQAMCEVAFFYLRKFDACTHVKFTRQWKSTLKQKILVHQTF